MPWNRSALALFVFLSLDLLESPLRAQGSNSCSTAQVISGPGPHAFDLTSATTGSDGQANAACNFNGSTAIQNDVWFRWTAPAAGGTFLLTTCQQTSVDTKVAVYGGFTCPPGAPVACDDDTGSVQSLARFTASSLQPFLFQVGTSPFGSTGTGTFRVLPISSATSDDCTAPDLAATTGFYGFDDTLASTGTQGQSNPGCVQVHNDQWFTWTAGSAGMAHLDTCGQTNADTAIAVYNGSGCPVSTSIACDDDGCNLQSLVQWPASAGATYTLQIGLSGGLSGSWGTFRISLDPPPANDDCATPASAAGNPSYDNSTATTGSQGQSSSCGPIGKDLWFTYTAATTGTATIETCFQTAVDTMIAVYPGSGCPAASALACNNDACGGQQSQVTIPITAGATYTIQIGSPPGMPGGAASFTIVETPSGGPVEAYCFGDGSGTPCPCGNVGLARRGCPNSVNPAGAKLDSSGNALVSADTFVLQASGMPPNSTAVYFQGTTRVNNGAGVVLGDGLRCVSGTFIRLGVETNTGAGSSGYGGPLGDTPISVRGAIPPTGGTRDYQVYYRNPAAFCTSATFNLSNGLEVIWSP